MVGFPSESEEQFENLRSFAKEYKLEHVGVFAYSKEEDTPSAKIRGHLDDDTKLERVDILGEILEENNRENNLKMVGKTLRVLYEDIDYERNAFIGRTQYNAPEIDSVVYFTGDFADVGEFYDVKITAVDGYDLIGEKV
jgi:ribosomal protein S12 methylthiotransferase